MTNEDRVFSDRLILACIVLFVCALVYGAVRAEADHWLCRINAEWSLGSLMEWDSANYTFVDLPDDLQIVDILYIQEDLNAAYVIYFSPSHQEHIIFPFWSLEARADANGEHMGNHDFCMPRRFRMGEAL